MTKAITETIDGIASAVENLARHQEQCDMDGVMVKVSRQALDEVLGAIEFINTALRLAAQSAAPVGEDISKDSTLYVERSMVRIGAIGSSDETMLKYVDSLPVFTAADFAAPAPSPPEVVGWQDISTAPRDGTPVLLGFPGHLHAMHGHCEDDVWGQIDSDFGFEHLPTQPTHWMPLPKGPSHEG